MCVVCYADTVTKEAEAIIVEVVDSTAVVVVETLANLFQTSLLTQPM